MIHFPYRSLQNIEYSSLCYTVGPSWLSIYFWLAHRLSGKESACQCRRRGFDPWVGKIPWRRAWQPTSVFLPGESPRTEEPGGLQSMGSQRVGHDWVTKSSTGFFRGKNRQEANEATEFLVWVTMRMTQRTEEASQSRKGKWWGVNKALMGSPRNNYQV